jgi:hypothetical protein
MPKKPKKLIFITPLRFILGLVVVLIGTQVLKKFPSKYEHEIIVIGSLVVVLLINYISGPKNK